VLEGIAKLYFNDTIKEIHSGDLIFLPKNNNHAVKVISKTPLKVLSVQSPGFYGLDRVFINKE
jgi:mannose-6-phosphate isomerase-like protein (cupin superfamily)